MPRWESVPSVPAVAKAAFEPIERRRIEVAIAAAIMCFLKEILLIVAGKTNSDSN